MRFTGILIFALMAAPEALAQAQSTTILENSHVRVVEVMAAPGETLSGVSHPGVLVSLGTSRVEIINDQGARRLIDHHPGEISWRDAEDPATWRVAAGTAHLIFVEVKSALADRPPSSPPLEDDHSSIVDPSQHHMVFENDHVRILDGMAEAGAESPPHTHPPSVLVSQSRSRFQVTISDRTRIFDFEPGMVRWTNHFEHRWRILSGQARVVMIEVKSAHGDPAFQRRQPPQARESARGG